MKSSRFMKYSISIIGVIAILLFCCNSSYAVVLEQKIVQEKAQGQGPIRTEVLVKLKEGVSPALITEQAGLGQAEAVRLYPMEPLIARAKSELGQENQAADGELFEQAYEQMGPATQGLYRIYKVTVPDGMSSEDIIAELKKNPDVEYAEPNRIFRAQMVPNDPLYEPSYIWEQGLWGLKKIGCETAWDISLGDGVVVAVIDTGVDRNHEDLAGNIWTNEAELSGVAGVDDDNNGYIDDIHGWDFVYGDNDPDDAHGHGTHCAGTVAAVGNNNIGVIGAAPKAKIMAVKGLGDNGLGYLSDLANCVYYAVSNGAKVLSNSWGAEGISPVLEDAFNAAYEQGAIGVAAAGNSDDKVEKYTPANIETVISVGASDQYDERCYFSNYGSTIGIFAPGGGPYDENKGTANIVSTMGDNSVIAQNNPDIKVADGYWRLAGTSMATPHVAGVCALMLSEHPEFTNADIKNIIQLTADDAGITGFDDVFGYGRINAAKAITMEIAPKKTALLANIEGYGFNTSDTVSIKGTAGGEDFLHYRLEYYKEGSEDGWIPIEVNGRTVISEKVIDGELGILNLGDSYGRYKIRLAVNSSDFTVYSTVSFSYGWPFDAGDPVSTDPVVADINCDNKPEVLFGTNWEGALYCVDMFGRKLWSYETGGVPGEPGGPSMWALSTPAVEDIDAALPRPPEREVLFVGANGGETMLYCLTGNGNKRWEYPLWKESYFPLVHAPAIVNLDGIGAKEILANRDEELLCLDNNGGLIWKYQAGEGIRAPSAIADLDEDGTKEIILPGRKKLHCIDKDGQMRWEAPINCSYSPAIADLDGDGPQGKDILVPSGVSLYCIDKDGAVRWKYDVCEIGLIMPFPSPAVVGEPVLADLDKDGLTDIVIIGKDEGRILWLTRLDKNGEVVWKCHVGSASGWIDCPHPSSATAADLTGDGYLETVVAAPKNGDIMLFCVDKDGELLWERKIDEAKMMAVVPERSSPTIADLDSDGALEIIIGTTNVNKVYCLDKNGEEYTPKPLPASGVVFDPAPWPMFRGDLAHTACYIPIKLPLAPSDLEAKFIMPEDAVSSGGVGLSWKDNSDNEEGFKIMRSMTADLGDGKVIASNWLPVATLGENVTAYTDTFVRAGTTYQYVVYAYNRAGRSERSNIAKATIGLGRRLEFHTSGKKK